MSELLKLKAADAEDLAVVSTCLQDSVIRVSQMTYQAEMTRFVMVANRFCWEESLGDADEGRLYQRINCGVRFDNVTAVSSRDLDRHRADRILSLLALEVGDGYIDLIFAERGVIRLEVDGILCHLDDLDDPWPTRRKPEHPADNVH